MEIYARNSQGKSYIRLDKDSFPLQPQAKEASQLIEVERNLTQVPTLYITKRATLRPPFFLRVPPLRIIPPR